MHQSLVFRIRVYDAVAGGKMQTGLSASCICSHGGHASCVFGSRELIPAKCFTLLHAVSLSSALYIAAAL